MAIELIETIDISTATSSVTFSSLPQDASDLLVIASVRSTDTVSTFEGGYDPFLYRLNNNDSNYTNQEMWGTGSSMGASYDPTRASNTYVTGTWGRWGNYGISNGNNSSNYFSYVEMRLLNYADSVYTLLTGHLIQENNNNYGHPHALHTQWQTTSAVTSISFGLGLGQFDANSTFSIYKIS